MFLSGGVGFQSAQLIPRSFCVCAKTSTATTLLPVLASSGVISNSNVRYAPATSFASAIFFPLIHTFARLLIPSKWSATCR